MATGFDDDSTIAPEGENKTAMELTDREKAIAKGQDPDKSHDEGAEEEADDTEVDDTDVDGKEAAASTSSGDSEETWIDDSVKELAESYGIDEDTLGSFENEKDFRRFAGIFEKTIGKSDEKPVVPEKKSDEPEELPADEALDLAAFETEGYDENTLKIVKSVSKLQEVVKGLMEQNGKLQQQLAAGSKQREMDALHREIDTLGGRFGKSDSLTAAQRKSRDTLIDAIEIVRQTLDKRGIKASSAVVLRRAELVAFGDEVLAEEKAKQKEALSQSVKKQSAKRRSVGRNTKPPSRKERLGEARDPAKAIANDPAIVEFWNNAQD